MEPFITCLDSVLVTTDFLLDDVMVGSVVTFRQSCATADKYEGRRIHRIERKRVLNGVQFYWTKGDNTSYSDECWVRHDHVDELMLEAQKDVYPENAALRDNVNAAKDSYDAALAEHEATVAKTDAARTEYNSALTEANTAVDEHGAAIAEYNDLCNRHTSVSGSCVVPTDIYNAAIALFNRADAALSRYQRWSARAEGAYERALAWAEDTGGTAARANTALRGYRCWLNVARESLRPGHIPPHECPTQDAAAGST